MSEILFSDSMSQFARLAITPRHGEGGSKVGKKAFPERTGPYAYNAAN
jgi:hypothetical protein